MDTQMTTSTVDAYWRALSLRDMAAIALALGGSGLCAVALSMDYFGGWPGLGAAEVAGIGVGIVMIAAPRR